MKRLSANKNRMVSLEIGRPLQVDDDDCDVGEPSPVDEACIQQNGIVMPPPGSNATNGLIAVIPVQRITAQLKKTLKARVITSAVLNTYDEHFNSIMASYPEPYPINSQAFLDPRLLTAACSLQVTRFFLYRHNLSPACRRDQRRDAMDRCVTVAKDTAHYIQRSMRQPSPPSGQAFYGPSPNWQARLRTQAPAFFCAHLWRCALILCMRLEFEAASTIIEASAAIGDMRKNNTACGRNLAFFLDKLIDNLRRGATPDSLETNEEMMAYVSGDLQGGTEEYWIWAGSETGSSLNSTQQTDGYPGGERAPEALSTSTLTEREMQEWGGWENLLRTVSQLHSEHQQQLQQERQQYQQQQQQPPPPPQQQQQQPQPPQQHNNAHHPYPPHPQTPMQYPPPSQTPNQHLAPQPPPPSHSSSLSPVGSNGNGSGNGSSRISIQDIM